MNEKKIIKLKVIFIKFALSPITMAINIKKGITKKA